MIDAIFGDAVDLHGPAALATGLHLTSHIEAEVYLLQYIYSL